MEYFEVVISPH